jgi:hypothetical protein
LVDVQVTRFHLALFPCCAIHGRRDSNVEHIMNQLDCDDRKARAIPCPTLIKSEVITSRARARSPSDRR